MFDIGMSELLLIGIVALIVVGPKDLPTLFRTLGRFTARARALGQDFTRAMNDAADEAGVKEAADTLRKAANPAQTGLDALKGAADRFEQWEPVSDDESAPKPAAERGGETAKLAQERKEAAEKIRAASAAKAEERLARERADAADDAADKTGTDPA